MGQPERPASTSPATNLSKFGVRPSGVEYHGLVEQGKRALANTRFASTSETLPALSTATEIEEADEPRYATCWGQLTFADLYQCTQRIAGSILVNRYGMTNPEDVDDCLQVGYLKVWQRLQTEPDWLISKSLGYFVRAVVLYCKSQRFSHSRYYRKLVYDAKSHSDHGITQIPQLETWLDLQKALTQVVTAIEDEPAMLLAFHTFVTQTPVTELQPSPGCASKTIYKKRRLIRQALAYALPGYGPSPEALPFDLNTDVQNKTSVSQHLLTDVPLSPLTTAISSRRSTT